jgi:Chaperone of endosialidase
MKNRNIVLTTILLAVGCFALSPDARAVCRDGCDFTNANTFLGDNALLSNTTGNNNTAIGAGALADNTTGRFNTAMGLASLAFNTTGSSNTASGGQALWSNTTGSSNTAMGDSALIFNTTGGLNTAMGDSALIRNETGGLNTAMGVDALESNGTGSNNTAMGVFALLSNTTGNNNTANGFQALFYNTTGNNNMALGVNAGQNLTTGDNNIDIGSAGVAAESNTIRIGTQGTQTDAYIAGIYRTTVARSVAVFIDSTGHLGTRGSSERLKDAIKPMGKASEAILALKPVTFRYKQKIDPEGIPQFGLVAEEVEKVNPALVARDAKGKVYTVRYDAVNAMLLNEFLKTHRKIEEQEQTISQLKSGMETLTATVKEQASQLQRVSAQLEATKPLAQVVNNP